MLQHAGNDSAEPGLTGVLSGRSAWLITDGKVGMDVQVRGIADALGLDYVFKQVELTGIWQTLSPYCPVPPRARFARPDGQFSPPWPDVAIATGRASIPFIRAIGRHAGRKTFRVVLQDPKTGPGIAHVIWVPEHDRRRGRNVITTLTAPHSFTAERLAELRSRVPDTIAALPAPRAAVIIGGPNSVYPFGTGDADRFSASLRSLATQVGSFLVTPSRRTPANVLDGVRSALEGTPSIIWTGEGNNPYPDFLAHADLLIVTADSVNMTGEACATGRPVYVFEPDGGSDKFRRFHGTLGAYGATRPMPAPGETIERWTYRPLDSAGDIAAALERRWLEFVSG